MLRILCLPLRFFASNPPFYFFLHVITARCYWTIKKMLGGLNPSTDLLVGSTSQYGPVLTELPSQLKSKQAASLEVSTAIPMSDQEEETHTLMDDNQNQATGPSTITSQIPGWVWRYEVTSSRRCGGVNLILPKFTLSMSGIR